MYELYELKADDSPGSRLSSVTASQARPELKASYRGPVAWRRCTEYGIYLIRKYGVNFCREK